MGLFKEEHTWNVMMWLLITCTDDYGCTPPNKFPHTDSDELSPPSRLALYDLMKLVINKHIRYVYATDSSSGIFFATTFQISSSYFLQYWQSYYKLLLIYNRNPMKAFIFTMEKNRNKQRLHHCNYNHLRLISAIPSKGWFASCTQQHLSMYYTESSYSNNTPPGMIRPCQVQ